MVSLCKTQCKTLRKFSAKLSGFFTHLHPTCVNLHFPTNFSLLSHSLSHHLLTPNIQLFFPLFHRTYYYYYNINILERN